MSTSRKVISSLVLFSALGVASALALGAAVTGALIASLGVGLLAVSDYTRQRRVFRTVRIATGEEPSVSHLRWAP